MGRGSGKVGGGGSRAEAAPFVSIGGGGERISLGQARVPARGDGIKESGDVGLPVLMVDFACRAKVRSEDFRRHDQVGAMGRDVGMQRLLDADGLVPGGHRNISTDSALRYDGIILHLAHPEFRIAAESELDRRKVRQTELQQVDLARFRGPALAATCTIDVTAPHVRNRDVLVMTT